MFQSIDTSFTNNEGHDSLSIQPILMVLVEFSIIEFDNNCGCWFFKSIPISAITKITIGLRCDDGVVPALITLNLFLAYFLKNASAI